MPSSHSTGASDGVNRSWEEKIVLSMDETTAKACIHGIRSEERARRVLGLCNEHGVSDGRKAAVVETVRELAD